MSSLTGTSVSMRLASRPSRARLRRPLEAGELRRPERVVDGRQVRQAEAEVGEGAVDGGGEAVRVQQGEAAAAGQAADGRPQPAVRPARRHADELRPLQFAQ